MTMIVTFILFGLVIAVVALRANVRFRRQDRLPMQWLLTGEVTWSAPRPVALALIPALALCTFAGLLVVLFNTLPRPGQEGMVIPSLIAIGTLFLAIQLFHLWLIEKTLRRNGS